MLLQHAIKQDHRQIFKTRPTKRWSFWQEKNRYVQNALNRVPKVGSFLKFSNFIVHLII